MDVEYPQHLHDAHTDLLFCPTREKPPGKHDDKLFATLCDKQRYIIHYCNLQQCTCHGLRKGSPYIAIRAISMSAILSSTQNLKLWRKIILKKIYTNSWITRYLAKSRRRRLKFSFDKLENSRCSIRNLSLLRKANLSKLEARNLYEFINCNFTRTRSRRRKIINKIERQI